MSSSETWRALAEARARKVLARAPEPKRERLQAVLHEMEHDPFAGDVARLHEQPTAFRRRVGDWRLFFEDDRNRAGEAPSFQRDRIVGGDDRIDVRADE